MAKVTLDTMLESINSRLGNVVYSEWKGIRYAKKYKKPKNANSDAQIAVRTAFKRVKTFWNPLPDAVKKSWDFHVKGKPLTGYNLFFKSNFESIKNEETIALSKSTGVTRVSNMTAEINATGDISVNFVKSDNAAFVSIFTQKIGETDDNLVLVGRLDIDTASMPVVLNGFDTAFDYNVYAVASDAPMNEAGYVSDSVVCGVKK